MAQKEKFSDDQLTDAVLRYAKAYTGIIKGPALVKWASENIPGMEGLRTHNFYGKRKVKTKTGKLEERNLKALDLIHEINSVRKGMASSGQNVFLHSSNLDAYLRLPRTEQRRQIIEARTFIENTISRNRRILRENDVIRAENEQLKEKISQQDRRLSEIERKQDTLDRHLRMIIQEIDAAGKAEILRSYGVMEYGFDLVAYEKSLHQDIEEVFSFQAAIRAFTIRHVEPDEEGSVQEEDKINLVDMLKGGLDI